MWTFENMSMASIWMPNERCWEKHTIFVSIMSATTAQKSMWLEIKRIKDSDSELNMLKSKIFMYSTSFSKIRSKSSIKYSVTRPPLAHSSVSLTRQTAIGCELSCKKSPKEFKVIKLSSFSIKSNSFGVILPALWNDTQLIVFLLISIRFSLKSLEQYVQSLNL